jgi:hypothetical protein
MEFSWDPAKSDANYRDRGFDFAFASLIFGGPTLEREDTRRDYGERRIIAIGRAMGFELTVCYTDRPGPVGDTVSRRIISARRSNRHERQAYRKAIAKG